MIKGTTPTFQLEILDEIDLTEALNVYVTFKQVDTVITKTGEDIEVLPRQVNVYLSQAETLQFVKGQVRVMMNITYLNGGRASSEEAIVDVDDNLLNEVLV